MLFPQPEPSESRASAEPPLPSESPLALPTAQGPGPHQGSLGLCEFLVSLVAPSPPPCGYEPTTAFL